MLKFQSSTSKFLRPISIAIVILLGVTTIIASNCNGVKKTSNFKDISVYPLERCPGTDVRAHWTTSPPTNIIIKFNGHTVEQDPSDDYVIYANDLDRLENQIKVEFRINCDDCEVREFTIRTIRDIEYYSRFGASLRDTNYRYLVTLPIQVWDENIYTHNLELSTPRIYKCTDSVTDYYYNWQYDKGRENSGYLNSNNGFRESFSHPLQAAGDWYFSIIQPDNEITCPGWKSNKFHPTVKFGVSCIKID